MRMTAADQLELGVVDEVISEPRDGAHTDHPATAASVKAAVLRHLAALERRPLDELIDARYRRYRGLGAFTTLDTEPVAIPERPGLTDRLRNLLGGSGRTTSGTGSNTARTHDEPPAREEV